MKQELMVYLREVKGLEHHGTSHRLKLVLNVMHRLLLVYYNLVNHVEADVHLEGHDGLWHTYHQQQL